MAVLETPAVRRFSVADVEKMLAAGILHKDEPIELLEGELVLMSPQSPRHVRFTEKISRLLEAAFGPGFYARHHAPLAAGPESLPEPDIAICPGDADRYDDRHPGGSEAVLVVEISHTSVAHDRRKAAIYARAGVSVYWRVDLEARRLEVRFQPQPNGEYAVTRVLGAGDRVEVPGTTVSLEVAELVP